METPLEEAPAEKARRLKALGAKLLAPLRRFASLSRRTLGLIAVVLLGASVIGWGAWFQYREGRGPGPSFSHLNRLEEFLYAPLGVPLREDVGRDLLSQGCFSEDLSASLETAPEFAALSKELSEPAVGGGDSPGSADISPSVRFFALEGNGVFALFEHKETPPLLRLLQVEGRHVPVKWGLRVGEPEEYLLRALGTPAVISADRRLYRDRWGSEVSVRVEEERIAALEWRYPRNLHFQ